jgi:hypothetical protein
MPTSQDNRDKYRKISRRLTEVRLELDDLRQKQDVTIAKLTKDIFSDGSLDKATYNERPKLLDAELTLRLDLNPEYQAIRKRERELALEVNDLEVEKDLMEEEMFEKFPRGGASLYEDDNKLDNL